MNLKLLGNKCASKEDYRKMLVTDLEELQALDGIVITEPEIMIYKGVIKDPTTIANIKQKIAKSQKLLQQTSEDDKVSEEIKEQYKSMEEFHQLNHTVVGILDSIEKRKLVSQEQHLRSMEKILGSVNHTLTMQDEQETEANDSDEKHVTMKPINILI